MSLLDGVRVLDLSRMLPAGALTQVLADLGADVVKVERPGSGDESRAFGARVAGTSATHAFLDRGKRSIALDLKHPDGVAVVRRLAARCDAVVESFRPGVAERLGLGYEDLRALNPRLVYCSVNGYGTGGPREQAPGHDLNYLAYAGVTGFGGSRAGGPAIAGVQSADVIGGLLGAVGLLAALISVRDGGDGERVALADAALWAIGLHVSSFLAGGEPQGPESTAITGATPSYRLYACADGRHLAVGAVEPQFWRALVEAVGRPDLAARQDDPAAIVELERLFATRTQREWLSVLEHRQACVAPVQDFADVVADEQYAARRMIVPVPGEPDVRQVGNPVHAAGASTTPAPAAATVGRDTAEILREIGLSGEELTRACRWAAPEPHDAMAMNGA
ncbi:MAG TPA: CaiB/BaiF CoA-transferase family protein [Solirubrobacteraceae bacterium]|nr:CaiB/BaiF CoA-transferase family protein [Solirubrobacteraceae bacterium]